MKPPPATIAFIGLGRMGLPMASNLLRAGFSVIGCDVDRAKAEALASAGAAVAASPAEAARRADLTFSMIMNDAVLHAVATGADGVLA